MVFSNNTSLERRTGGLMKLGLPQIPGGLVCRSVCQYSNLTCLPYCEGVTVLSKSEIKKDIKEIERCLNSDSDSDSTIKSEDILPSTYPVKPRRTPKPSLKSLKHPSQMDENEQDNSEVGNDEAFEFLKAVEASRPDIFDAEKEREKLEIQYLVILMYFSSFDFMLIHSFQRLDST